LHFHPRVGEPRCVSKAGFLRGSARIIFALSAVLDSGCKDERRPSDALPTYQNGIGDLLASRCGRCHAGATAAAGWRADSYPGAIGCTTAGMAVTLGAERAPLLVALGRADHAALLDQAERERLAAWVAAGTPSSAGGVHPPTFADPRTTDGHARFLRDRRHRPLVDAQDADACGHCHDGAPTTLSTSPAPGATACTSCHVEPGGVFACTTCHGGGGRAYPPRDRCFFPETPGTVDAHLAHAGRSPARAEGLPCTTCHPVPSPDDVVRGAHVDGHVEVFFDYARVGNAAVFDATTKRCTGTCHARGGARPVVAWTEAATPAGCNDCHRAPPEGHYVGACTSCHREANATGTALVGPVLHVDGVVDRGDGTGGCGACHGSGTDPWPSTGAHAAHARPAGAREVDCGTCHVVPDQGSRHPVGGGATVTLRGLAVKNGARATFDPVTKTCAETYCHAGRGAGSATPSWVGGSGAAGCGSCHAVPPPPPHVQVATCDAATSCHQGSLASPSTFTPAGRAAHVDGWITRGLP